MRYCFSQQDAIVWEHSGRQWNGSFASFSLEWAKIRKITTGNERCNFFRKKVMDEEVADSQSLSKTFSGTTRSVTNAEMRERNDSFFFFAIPSMFLAHFK